MRLQQTYISGVVSTLNLINGQQIWKGSNVCGKILMMVRDECLSMNTTSGTHEASVVDMDTEATDEAAALNDEEWPMVGESASTSQRYYITNW